MTNQGAEHSVSIEDVWVNRAVFQPGEAASLHILLNNQETGSLPIRLHLSLMSLDEKLWESSQRVETRPGKQQLVVPLELPTESFRGYGVDLTLCDEYDSPWEQKSTALDVLESWTQAPRYGFLADFAPG